MCGKVFVVMYVKNTLKSIFENLTTVSKEIYYKLTPSSDQ